MDPSPSYQSSRNACLVVITSSLTIAMYQGVMSVCLFLIALWFKVRSWLHSCTRGKLSPPASLPDRRLRWLWRLATDLIPATIYVLLSLAALRGFVYELISWKLFAVVSSAFLLLSDAGFLWREAKERRSAVGFMMYSLTTAHLVFTVVLLLAGIVHVVQAYQAMKATMYANDDDEDGATTGRPPSNID